MAPGPTAGQACLHPRGYYILGCDFETVNEIRLVADAGPLGYQTIAAHGHADALRSPVGRREGVPHRSGDLCLSHARPVASLFRGTAAHNTLRVDGMDQSQSGGNFIG